MVGSGVGLEGAQWEGEDLEPLVAIVRGKEVSEPAQGDGSLLSLLCRTSGYI